MKPVTKEIRHLMHDVAWVYEKLKDGSLRRSGKPLLPTRMIEEQLHHCAVAVVDNLYERVIGVK
jgi:hypothetical protein